MLKAYAYVDVVVPASQVWQLIAGFNSLPQWLPYITGSELEDGGRIRRLCTIADGTIVERLLSFDDKAQSYSYQILQTPFPVQDYVSTFKVTSLPDEKGCRIEWSGEFFAAGIPDEDAFELIQGIYEGGLEALQLYLSDRF